MINRKTRTSLAMLFFKLCKFENMEQIICCCLGPCWTQTWLTMKLKYGCQQIGIASAGSRKLNFKSEAFFQSPVDLCNRLFETVPQFNYKTWKWLPTLQCKVLKFHTEILLANPLNLVPCNNNSKFGNWWLCDGKFIVLKIPSYFLEEDLVVR